MYLFVREVRMRTGVHYQYPYPISTWRTSESPLRPILYHEALWQSTGEAHYSGNMIGPYVRAS